MSTPQQQCKPTVPAVIRVLVLAHPSPEARLRRSACDVPRLQVLTVTSYEQLVMI